MSTVIWLNDPTILLKYDKIKDIWPQPHMSSEEKVNAITRLVILLTLIGYLLTLSYKIFYIKFSHFRRSLFIIFNTKQI